MKKILIVDDDASVLWSARISLNQHGYTTLEASNGAEALDLAAVERPDLVLSDVSMNGMDGFELLKRLRAKPDTATIPVILMTGLPEQATVRYSMEHGADDYLPKPFDNEQLLSAVKARLERQQILQTNAKANEARLLGLLSATHDLIAIADPSTGALLYLNSAGRKMLGISQESNLSNFQLCSFLPDGPNLTISERLARVQQDGIWVGEGEVLGASGSRVPVFEQIISHGSSEGMAAYLSIVARNISERKRAEAELERTHAELVETSRRAGMAEVATGVLHNVGNALTSINVASGCMAESLRNSNAGTLSKVVALFRQHEADLGQFLSFDPKGKQIPGYLGQLSERLIKEQQSVLQELARLQKIAEHIKNIVCIQQTAAKGVGGIETLKVADLVDDALLMEMKALSGPIIEVSKEIHGDLFIAAEKHKVLQILINLIRNAQQACLAGEIKEKKVIIRTQNGGEYAHIAVSDTGVGIRVENLNHIFDHGFTTKMGGHGFGLHSCALLAKEMGGTLRVESQGLGKGATFILELPKPPPVNGLACPPTL